MLGDRAIVLNLKTNQINLDFRMNERVFSTSLASKKHEVQEIKEEYSYIKNWRNENTVVHKFAFDEDPMQTIKGNFYLKHAREMKRMKSELNDENGLIKTAYDSLSFEGRSDIKPIRWIGTQRGAFTHRVKMKRVKDIIAKEKVNK